MRPLNFLVSILLITTFVACAAPTPAPEVSQAEIDKALSALLTQAPANPANEASATPLPVVPTPQGGANTATLAPPATLLPTQTPLPTYTAYPTYTPFVVATLIPATPTAIFTAKPKPEIAILAVQENTAVSAEAGGFSPGQTLKIRVGPYDTFSTNAVEVGTVNSGSSGTVKFSALLPGVVQDVEKVTIRLDGSMGEVAYTTFTNQTSGTVPTVSATVTSAICQVTVSPALGAAMDPNEDFDAVWTVKNISGKKWELYTTDYRYIKGTEMQKFGSAYDVDQVVDPGEAVSLTVDMVAPADPGTYSATWGLFQGSTLICTLPVKIAVK